MTRLRSNLAPACALVGIWICCVAAATAEPIVVILSADTEGRALPCQTCPARQGIGGLARRATLIQRQRSANPATLLLDAGNTLFGVDSIDSSGRIMVATYDAMGYDAVNISYRDFRLGLATTTAALKEAKFASLSTNLLEETTGQLLFKPYLVKQIGGQKVAVLGVTESPPGIDQLPHLKEQLAGVKFRPPAEALAEWLPKAKADADKIVVLCYGSPRLLRNLHKQFSRDVALFGAGGLRPDQLDTSLSPPIATAFEEGKSLAVLDVASGAAKARQEYISAALPEDPAVQRLISEFRSSGDAVSSTTVERPQPPATTPAVKPADAPPVAVKPPPTTAPIAPAYSSQTSPPSNAPARPSLPRTSARQPHQAKGLAGAGLTEAQVNAAIDRARDALWSDLAPRLPTQVDKFLDRDGSDLLVALALVHAKAHLKYPEFDKELRSFLASLDPGKRAIGTYQSAIVCMIIEALGDPMYLPKMRQLVRMLVEFQIPNGSWDYGMRAGPFDFLADPADNLPLTVEGGIPLNAAQNAGRKFKRLSPWTATPGGDYSTSQFALLGLRSAARGHIHIDDETWERALTNIRTRASRDGGWGYTPESDFSYGSMTCAGICSIAICRYQLGKKDPADDVDIEHGLAWLEKNFTLTTNPQYRLHQFYYLYSIERLGQILETEFIGPHEWYPLGAKYLIDSQLADGNWKEDGEDVVRRTTSFAILFLTRATAKLKVELKHGGAGTVKAISITPPPNRLYVILDGSGSMLEQMGDRAKFDIARDAISEIVASLPDSSEVALRVYGHRKRATEQGASDDTALEVRMEKLDRGAFAATLAGLRPRGRTPMAVSLAAAKQDLAALSGQPVTVVLLTDGGEDSQPRRDPVQAAGAFAGAKGVTFHIVGFDINQPDWGRQLRDMAARGRAHYWSAAKADLLVRELRQAVLGTPAEFKVLDPAERELWRGQFGESKSLPEGQYRFQTDYAGQPFTSNFWVNTDATTGVLFDASRIGGPTTAPADEPPASPPARFCAGCGAKLQPAARFCTSCGQRIAP